MGPASRFRVEAALLVLVMALFVGAATLGGWFRGADRAIHDTLVRVKPLPPLRDVMIVGVDERSLARFGPWPWGRDLQAQLLYRIAAGRPRAALVDVVFAGVTEPAADEALVQAATSLPLLALPMIIDALSTGGQLIEVLPFPELLDAADVLGHVHVELDADAVVRGTYLYQGIGGPHWPHVAMALAGTLGVAEPHLSDCPEEVPYSIQNVRCGWVYLPFAGPPGSFAEISAADLLDGSVGVDVLADRIVLLGVTASAASDRLPSPVSGDSRPLSGIEMNANLLSAIIQGELIRDVPLPWVVGLGLLCVAMPALLLPRLQPKAMLAVAGLGAVLPLLLTVSAHLVWRMHLPLSAAVVTALAAYPYWSWRRHEIAWHFVAAEMSRLSLERSRWPVPESDGRFEGVMGRLASLLQAHWRRADLDSGDDGMDRLPVGRHMLLLREAPFGARERAYAARVAESLAEGDAPAEVLPGERLTAQIRSLQQAAGEVRTGRDVGRRSLAEMPNGVAVLSSLGEVLFVNDAARQLLELTSEESPRWYETLLAALVAPLGRSWRDVAAAVLIDGESVSLEAQTTAGVSVLFDAAPLAAAGEPVDRWIITLTDMTEIRAAERDREEALAFLSHDLRSPMLSVLALVRDAGYSQVLADIGRYAEKALATSEQFLQLSRVQARERFETYELNVLDVLQNAADGIFMQARDQEVTVSLDPRVDVADEGLWVRGNGELLERAFVNLFDNAIKYSDAGSTVSVHIEHGGGRITLVFEDRGLGIPQDEQNQVFEPYFRSSDPALAERRGAGLGLRFVKTVVQRHGGEIHVSSRPGAGSRFSVILPELNRSLGP